MPNYNTPMLHFAPYVTFQPCVRQILAHCTSPFGPVAMPTNEHPHPYPLAWAQSHLGWKSIKENMQKKWINKVEGHVKFNDFCQIILWCELL